MGNHRLYPAADALQPCIFTGTGCRGRISITRDLDVIDRFSLGSAETVA